MAQPCFAPVMVGKRLLTTPSIALRADCHPMAHSARGAKIRVKGNPIAGGLTRGAPAHFVGRCEDGLEVSVQIRQSLTRTGYGDYHSMRRPTVSLIVSEDAFWDLFDFSSLASTASWLSRE